MKAQLIANMKTLKHRKLHQLGAALLEVIVAIGIVTLVMTTIVSLVTVSLKSASIAQSKSLGTKYSQEGLESLRQMRNVLGWDAFLGTLQADGTTIHYCLTSVPTNAAEFASLPNAACSGSQFVDQKNIFQRQADITIAVNGSRTSVAISVKTTWDDSGVQKQSLVTQQFEEYNTDDAPAPVVYSPLPYGYGIPGIGIWTYREPIPVTNSSGVPQSDYQVMVTLDTAALISTSKMKSACADLRISDSDGQTFLPFWIEPTTCNTATTKIWVKVPSIPTQGTTLYAMYGNALAIDDSSPPSDIFIRLIPNLVAAWNMDQTSWVGAAGEVKDTSGNNNNGVSNTATITAGKFGNAGLFNGTSNFLNFPNSASLSPATAVSTSSWIKTSAVNVNSVIIGKSTGCASSGYLVWLNENAVGPGKPGFWASGGGWVASPLALNDGAWHHIVTTFDGATANVYSDGVLRATGPRTSNLSTPNILQIGGASAAGGGCLNFFFNGSIDDVDIFNRGLSAAEVVDLYGAGQHQAYSTPNYPNVGLDRKYANVTTTGAGAEQSGTYLINTPIVDWSYRQPVTITNSSGAIRTQYQVAFVVNTASLISAGKMNSDCSDVRVIDSSGVTIPYWIQTGTNPCDTATTVIWAKAPTLPTGSTTLYLVYGNDQATSLSNPNTTFDFFDDFSTNGVPPGWVATGASNAVNGEVTIANGALYKSAAIVPTTLNELFEVRAKWAATPTTYSGFSLSNTNSIAGSNGNANKMAMVITNANASISLQAFAGDGSVAGYNIVSNAQMLIPTANTYYFVGMAYDGSTLKYFMNRGQSAAYPTAVQYAPLPILGYFLGNGSGTADGTDMTVDYMIGRKFANSIPNGTMGAEESGSWTGL